MRRKAVASLVFNDPSRDDVLDVKPVVPGWAKSKQGIRDRCRSCRFLSRFSNDTACHKPACKAYNHFRHDYYEPRYRFFDRKRAEEGKIRIKFDDDGTLKVFICPSCQKVFYKHASVAKIILHVEKCKVETRRNKMVEKKALDATSEI